MTFSVPFLPAPRTALFLPPTLKSCPIAPLFVSAKVMTAFFLTFFPVTVNTLRGLKSCDPQRIALMKSFGAGRLVMFFKLAVPSALPQIMVGLRVAIGLSLIGSVVGEWFGETVGLGVMLMEAMNADLVLRLWVVMFACGLMGALLYGLLTFVERRLVWWRSES